ncbi:MAG: putative toxin-antitoxin system toxin component, PIN family [Bryobacterales bacterium]|nr:putative toxin-antitoxin system toxin component, PIN family [Bryobacterales bacterium]
MRIVLDTNVPVRSTAKADGLGRRLLHTISTGPHRLIMSPFILDEVARVLAYRRIRSRWGLTDEDIQEHLNLLAAAAEIVDPVTVDRVVLADPDDDAIVQTALSGRADVLCTRDVHLSHPNVLQFRARHGIRVMDDIDLYRTLHP